MIRTLKLCLIGLAILSATGCSKTVEEASPTEETSQVPAVDKEGSKTEKTVSAVAAKLELGNGATVEDMRGAQDGARFEDQKVEIYIFDKTSEAYKTVVNGGSDFDSYCCNDGVVLVFTGSEVDVGLMTHFYELTF